MASFQLTCVRADSFHRYTLAPALSPGRSGGTAPGPHCPPGLLSLVGGGASRRDGSSVPSEWVMIRCVRASHRARDLV